VLGIQSCGATAHPMAELDLPMHAPFDEYLHVPRFDRRLMPDGARKRIHFEEPTLALGEDPKHKYKNLPAAIASLLRTLQNSSAAGVLELAELLRRCTAFALMGNTDAHGKNWVFIYRDGINRELAPACDLVCVSAYFDPANPKALSVNRAMERKRRRRALQGRRTACV
jgi:serine/threonine-protein kinase HipA